MRSQGARGGSRSPISPPIGAAQLPATSWPRRCGVSRAAPIASAHWSRSCGRSSRSRAAATSTSTPFPATPGSTSKPRPKGCTGQRARWRGGLRRRLGPGSGRAARGVARVPAGRGRAVDLDRAQAARGDPRPLARARRARLRLDRRRRAGHRRAGGAPADRAGAVPREWARLLMETLAARGTRPRRCWSTTRSGSGSETSSEPRPALRRRSCTGDCWASPQSSSSSPSSSPLATKS